MTVVQCGVDSCINNLNGICSLQSIYTFLEYGDFNEGKWKTYVACQNYRSNEDAEHD